ncbi:MAG: ketopantoate reductase family protein [Chloroflexi bacterium]|nr:ketopantoate reductase family protein [Chloroflexota bacterium]
MRIAILGAGALGSFYGGYLARAGMDVTLIGRPPHIKAVQENGLHITGHDAFIARPSTTLDARTLKDVDLLLICVRTTDLERALQDVSHLQPEIVTSFQNGLHIEEKIEYVFGPGPVVGASSVVGARTVKPGHVHCDFFGHTWFGERDHHITPRVRGIVKIWRKAGLLVTLTEDIQAVEWSKLAYLLPVSTISGLTRLPYHQILQSPDLAYLFIQIVREVNNVARTYGIELQDYPALNLRTLIDRPFQEGVRFLAARGIALERDGRTDINANMLTDILRRRPTEIEAFAADLMRHAQDAGLALPAISLVYRAIRGIDALTGGTKSDLQSSA